MPRRLSSWRQRSLLRFHRKLHWVRNLRRKAAISRERVFMRRYWPYGMRRVSSRVLKN